MAEIRMTNGGTVIVDDSDYEWLSKYKWSLKTTPGRNYGYAVRHAGLKTIRMHRDILGVSGDQIVDHANGNTLDNRRENLRPCSYSQNQANRGPQRNNTSGYKGVSWSKQYNAWIAQIQKDHKFIFLGSYETPDQAHAAYEERARELFGEFHNS